ncbi:MAG TPA: hypothetical protein VGB49_05325 [Caulobacteraceae bacterium]
MRATAVEGEIVILGPGSMSGSFTREAALASITAIQVAIRQAAANPLSEVDLD